MRSLTKTASSVLVLIILLFKVHGRSLQNKSSGLVSYGTDDVQSHEPSFLLLKGMGSSDECEHMYGFLPCSSNIYGHLFLIVVYEYLLFRGESLMVAGGEQIFKLLGPGIFGASAFHILGALPESLIVLATGLLNTKEVAQEYVSTGVGLLAGSSIFLLTILWGTCLIAGSQDLSNNSNGSNSTQTARERLRALWTGLLLMTLSICLSISFIAFTGRGITTDLETSYTSRIMALSIIPFIIIQFINIISSTSGEDIVILIALVVSTIFLFLFFFYQFFEPWIQNRKLEFVKHKHLILTIVQHVQEHALRNILTDDGAPNVSGIKRLFEEIDRDGDNYISPSQLKELLLEMNSTGSSVDREREIAEVMREFDVDGDQKISKDEFVSGFAKWLHETKHAMDKQYFSRKSYKDVYQVFGPWLQNKRKEHDMKKTLIPEILRFAQSNVGNLLHEDGTPDTHAIKRLFEAVDHDKDNCISRDELKKLIADVKFGKAPVDMEEAVDKVFEELDADGDHQINEEEFSAGFPKLIQAIENPPPTIEAEDDVYQKTWEEIERLVAVGEEKSKAVVENSFRAWFNALTLLVFGIAVLGVLAEPLISSVQNFSEAASIPSLFVSFILVPLATNARAAASAITTSRHKKPRTTSLTFCEIYSGVFMNNVLGFSVLLLLIYVRGMTWEYSAEVLVVVVVCAAVGVFTSFRTTFPLWTSFLAYLLYPLSLILVYVFRELLD